MYCQYDRLLYIKKKKIIQYLQLINPFQAGFISNFQISMMDHKSYLNDLSLCSFNKLSIMVRLYS